MKIFEEAMENLLQKCKVTCENIKKIKDCYNGYNSINKIITMFRYIAIS